MIQRRTYNVPGPNSLWHIDSHHSLIQWRFVIHGCIDGYSRLITHLKCCTDNKSATTLDLFMNSVGLPSRVRSDKGMENIRVCEYMVSVRGTGRHSHIAGASTHNQRIERLWRDVYRCVAATFHSLFYLEAFHELDPLSDVDLFVLHTVFLPRINKCLSEFAAGWNSHPMRNERNWSPKKIWLNGVIDPTNASHTAICDITDPTPDIPEEFGIDPEGTLPLNPDEDGEVVVPDTVAPLSGQALDEFILQANPLEECSDYGVGKYTTVHQLLNDLLEH